MDESADRTAANDRSPNRGMAGAEAAAPTPENLEMVGVEIRITPVSLLLTSALGAFLLTSVVLVSVLLLPIDLLPIGNGSSADVASLFSSFGLELLLAFGGLVSLLFVVGYRRHGRPVPTEARAWRSVLAVRVPVAWGTLIRDELHLTDPSLNAPPNGSSKTDPQGAPSTSGGPDRNFLARGTAPEWWDPGTYEVFADTEAADVLKSKLTGDGEMESTGR